MVTGGQTGDERDDRVRLEVDDDDTRAVVVTGRANALVGVGREQTAALRPVLEADVDRGTVGLKTVVRPRGLAERTGDLVAVLVQHQDVGGGRSGRRESPAIERVVAVGG